MPPQSRGAGQTSSSKPHITPIGFQSKSTPILPTLRSFSIASSADSESTHPTPTTSNTGQASPDFAASSFEAESIDEFSLDSLNEPQSLSPASSDDDDVEDQEEVDGRPTISKLPPKPPLYKSHSHQHLAPLAFAPPFYGRPPTPLPPSPSLTSLLRPNLNFSTQFSSRPGTPNESSDEGTPKTGTQTPNSAAASTLTSTFRAAKPIPRASPRVPTYEYYGFTLYLTSSLAFIVYVLWSYLPSPFLEKLGIYYYPNRWWALAIPAWTVMFVIYIYVALASYNTGYLTLPMDSVECLVDEAANVAIVDADGKLIHDELPSWQRRKSSEPEYGGRKKNAKSKTGGRNRQGSLSQPPAISQAPQLDWRSLWNEGTDAVMDIPLGGVCEILYAPHEAAEYDVTGNAHDR